MAAQETQAQKRAAAEGYKYESDSRWADYWSNVLIPQQMIDRPDVKRHFQLKFYQRYIDAELEVEPLSSLKDSSAPRMASSTQQRPVNTGSQARSTGGSVPPRPTPRASPQANSMLRLDQKTFQFLNNAWVVVMALVAYFPFSSRGLSDRAYRLALVGSAVSCAHGLYQQIRRPRTWNMEGLQEWLQSILPSKDFLPLIFSLLFFSSWSPIKFAVIPVLCRSLEQVVFYLRGNFNNTQLYKRYLQRPCELLTTNRTMLYMTSARAEIALGFTLIVLMVTPQRNIVLALIYWQLLKLFYRAPASAGYHQQTWSSIGGRANPLIHRFAPVLERPLDYVRNWFIN